MIHVLMPMMAKPPSGIITSFTRTYLGGTSPYQYRFDAAWTGDVDRIQFTLKYLNNYGVWETSGIITPTGTTYASNTQYLYSSASYNPYTAYFYIYANGGATLLATSSFSFSL